MVVYRRSPWRFLAVVLGVLAVIAAALLIGLLVPWHKTPGPPPTFSSSGSLANVQPGPSSVTFQVCGWGCALWS